MSAKDQMTLGRSGEVVEQLDGRTDRTKQSSRLSNLEDLFAPLTTAEFLATRYRERQAVLFRGPQDRFKSIVTWQDVNRFVSSRALAPKMMVLPREGSVIPIHMVSDNRRGMGLRPFGEQVPVVDHKLLTVLRRGATLVLNRIHQVHPAAQALVSRIEDATEGYGQANLYASWTNSRGFATHWDTHDAFIFQLSGCKRWFVYGETRAVPLDMDVSPNADPPSKPLWDGFLTPGDVLFLPRGTWHDARVENPAGEGIGSLHLTVSTIPVTGRNLLRWLVAKLSHHELFRMDLPLRGDKAGQQERFAALRDLIVTTLDEVSMEEFRSDARACWSEPPGTTLDASIEPWKLGDSHWNQCEVSIRGVRRSTIKNDGEGTTFALIANGQTWTLDRHCLPLLEFLTCKESATVGTVKEHFADCFSHGFVDEFLQILVEKGVAKIAIPESIGNLA